METTAIIFDEQDLSTIRIVIIDLECDSHSAYQLKIIQNLENIERKIKTLVEQCSGATQPAAEEHLNAR